MRVYTPYQMVPFNIVYDSVSRREFLSGKAACTASRDNGAVRILFECEAQFAQRFYLSFLGNAACVYHNKVFNIRVFLKETIPFVLIKLAAYVVNRVQNAGDE